MGRPYILQRLHQDGIIADVEAVVRGLIDVDLADGVPRARQFLFHVPG